MGLIQWWKLLLSLLGREDASDSEFVEWSERYDNRVNSNERAILVKWGGNPDWTRTVLMKMVGHSHSIRTIHDKAWDIGRSANGHGNDVYNKADKLNAALKYAQATEADTGKLPPEKEIAEATGVSTATANEALLIIRHNRPEDIGRVQFTKATQAHIDALTARRLKELEKEFNERVRVRTLEENRDYLSQLNRLESEAKEQKQTYQSLNNDHKPIFNETEFTIILTCLHPDNSASKEKRDMAFKAFNAMKFQLTGKR